MSTQTYDEFFNLPLASLPVGTFHWVVDQANDLAPFKPGGSLWALLAHTISGSYVNIVPKRAVYIFTIFIKCYTICDTF